MYSKSKISLFSNDAKVNIKNRSILKKFIEEIFKKERKEIEFANFIFCSDKTILNINRQYLKHDYYTDIITFNLSETDDIQGEIFISIDRVRENAHKLGVSFNSELHRVIFHGILHLCGYRDQTKFEKNKIREKEDFYLTWYLT